MTCTAEQVGHLRHAMGLDDRRPCDRNYFAATPGSPDDELWKGLVAAGLAFHRKGTPTATLPYNYYHVTAPGMLVARREVDE